MGADAGPAPRGDVTVPGSESAGAAALRYAYITNGMRDHRLVDAIDLLADCGYSGIGLTLDHGHLDPFAPDLDAAIACVREQLERRSLGVVVETGARFLLDPRRKHEPTLLGDHGRQRRIEFLQRAVQVAAELGAPAVSLWSGKLADGVSREAGWERLVDGCAQVLTVAEQAGITLGFEPEPGMLVETINDFERLAKALGDPAALGITLDIGHCQCLEAQSPAECVRRVADRLVHVQIEDMRRGVHEHLMFGDGEIDFPPVLQALAEIGYDGLVAVELSRHSHTAHTAVPQAIEFLRRAVPTGEQP